MIKQQWKESQFQLLPPKVQNLHADTLSSLGGCDFNQLNSAAFYYPLSFLANQLKLCHYVIWKQALSNPPFIPAFPFSVSSQLITV